MSDRRPACLEFPNDARRIAELAATVGSRWSFGTAGTAVLRACSLIWISNRFMRPSLPQHPPTLGLFEKRIDGDDCLMDLARLRFQQAGMGTEMHAGTPAELDWVMQWRPSPATPVVVHLPRHFDLTDEHTRAQVQGMAAYSAGRIHGFVLHDGADMAVRAADYHRAAQEMESRLARIQQCPLLFIEYAAGLEPDLFAGFFSSIRNLSRLSACIDIGHVGIRQARKAFAQVHPGEDVCALKSNPSRLPQLMPDVEAAVRTALPTVLHLIETLGALGKPIHFHLHDGHPLSTFSPFGVSDHLSFFQEMPLPFDCHDQQSSPLMFGPNGLSRIVAKAMEAIGRERVSFTLEIHPTFERLALGDAANLFEHWRDRTNAEMMNHWLAVLSRNHELLLAAISKRAADALVAHLIPRPTPLVLNSPRRQIMAPVIPCGFATILESRAISPPF